MLALVIALFMGHDGPTFNDVVHQYLACAPLLSASSIILYNEYIQRNCTKYSK